jgi:hypothetical protein
MIDFTDLRLSKKSDRFGDTPRRIFMKHINSYAKPAGETKLRKYISNRGFILWEGASKSKPRNAPIFSIERGRNLSIFSSPLKLFGFEDIVGF